MAQVVDTRALFEAEVKDVTVGRLIDALDFWAREHVRSYELNIDWHGGHWNRAAVDDETCRERPKVVLERGACEGYIVAIQVTAGAPAKTYNAWECKVQTKLDAGMIAAQLAEEMTWIH